MSYPVATIAEFLKADALYVAVDELDEALIWGERGVESETISPLAHELDAIDEATRQFAFLRGPLVEDVVTIGGARRDLMLRVIQLSGAASGKALVIGYRELDAETELNVVRSLA